MNDIASSLEQEFADHSQADRDAHIAQLREIESKGRGSVEIRPHAIIMSLVFGFGGVMMVWASIKTSSFSTLVNIALGIGGAACVVYCVWSFIPRKPRFTLTEEGVRVKDVLLPWSSIEEYSVTVQSYIGFMTNYTSVEFEHAAGFTPPKLNIFYMFGATHHNRKTGRHTTYMILYGGAKGMNGDKLSRRIGEFLSAARARTELARLQAL